MSLRAGSLPDLVLRHLADVGADYPRHIAQVLDRKEAAVSGCLQGLVRRGLAQRDDRGGVRRYYEPTGTCPACGSRLSAPAPSPTTQRCERCGETLLEPSPTRLCGFCHEEREAAGA